MSLQTDGLDLEQAPPLAIPFSFFATAPLMLVMAGVLLTWKGSALLVTGWSPWTLSVTHLGTLGFLTMVMMGALYQMTPVVAGSPVPGVRLAHVVHVLLVAGLLGFCAGVMTSSAEVVFWSITSLFLALATFVTPVGLALARAPSRSETVLGMGAAVLGLLVTAAFGLWMAHGHSGMRFPGPRSLWIQVHLSIGLLGWVGGLITSVSWQVLPMFYLSSHVARGLKRVVQRLVALGVMVPVVVLFADYFGAHDEGHVWPRRLAALGALPAVVAVWVIHPAASIVALRRRRRRRPDASLLFWTTGLWVAPITAVAAVATFLHPSPRWGLLLVWLSVWGWAGMIVHGMLMRIIPFLVWFHRFAPLVGEVSVPSARALLPARGIQVGFGIHLVSVALGVIAILTSSDVAARLTGLLLIATGASLMRSLGHVLRQRPVE